MKVFITRAPDPEAVALLRRHPFAVEVAEQDGAIARADLVRRVRDADGLLCFPGDRIDREVMAAAPSLKVIGICAVGYDNVDVQEAAHRGIAVCNTPGVLTEATADLTWALLLAVARKIVAGDRLVRSGGFRGWDPGLLLGVELHGKILGIVGLGRIGSAVARRAKGFGLRVLYHKRRRLPPDLEDSLAATYASLEQLLARSDVVSLHCPLTPETDRLLGRRELERMKPTAILINTARGPIVDEAALIGVLREKKIAGAGLDVYEREPALSEELLRMEQVVLLPHLGSATVETRRAMACLAAENIIAVLTGRRPPHPVA